MHAPQLPHAPRVILPDAPGADQDRPPAAQGLPHQQRMASARALVEEFRLLAVSARYPRDLAGQVALEELKPGVYQVRRRGTSAIRVVVLRRLPREPHNALWLLFSGVPEQIAYAVRYYRQRSPETGTLLDQLIEGYQREDVVMPYTMEQFRHDYLKEHVSQLSVKERLAGLSPEEVVKHLSPDEILKHLPREAIENFLNRLRNGSALPPE